MGRALLTDLYELNMAASYHRRRMTGLGTFSLFVRRLPAERGFLVASGVEACLDHLEQLAFEPEDLDYLAGEGFDDESLAGLAALRFTGDVRAVPEGRIVFAGEPLMEVTAPIAEAQLVETFLLNQVGFATSVASKAARCRLAARGRMDLVEFGFRRTQGIDAGITAARAAVLVGFSATSNVEAARRHGLRPSGTMAHSYVQAFPSEIDAFEAFAADRPGPVTFLVDTYDTRTGVANAIQVIRQRGLGATAGIRLDSGDLAALAFDARNMLDAAGLPDVHIFASGNLDEHRVAALVAAGAPIDAVGIGTSLGVSADAPALDTVYKLVAFDGRPVAKLSPAKATYPGAKQVFRPEGDEPGRTGAQDLLGLADEPVPPGSGVLLLPVMAGGRRTHPPGDPGAELAAARARFEADLRGLPPAALRLEHPEAPTPSLTVALRQLTDEVHTRLARNVAAAARVAAGPAAARQATAARRTPGRPAPGGAHAARAR